MTQSKPLWRQIFTTRMLACIVTGTASGMPLYVLIQMIPTWLRDAQIDLETIGLFSLTSLPYVWKFLWAAIFDVPLSKPKNIRRRSWALLWQGIMVGCLIGLAFLNPKTEITYIACLSVLMAFASASQDAVLDAHRREILPDAELGLGSSIFVNAYRLSSIIPGSLALIIADQANWQWSFLTVAGCLLLLMIMTCRVPEIEVPKQVDNPSIQEVFWDPLRDFLTRHGQGNVLLILSFMLFYKLGDSMATALASPFYLDLGFTKSTLASTVKVASLWSSIAGGLIGGIWMLKLGIQRSLWIFGWFQLITILGFYWLAMDSTILPLHTDFPDLSGEEIARQQGLIPNTSLLFIVVSAEYLGVGLGTAAFVAFIAQNTNKQFSAAQYAILTSISGLPRTLAASTSGWFVNAMGYPNFFLMCTLLAFPGLGLVIIIKRSTSLVEDNSHQQDDLD